VGKNGVKNCFPSRYRLLKRSDFLHVANMGCKIVTPHFIICYMENVHSHARLGVTVSKKIGNAVLRNKLKRYLREFFRNNKNIFKNNYDFSIIARNKISNINHEKLNLLLTNTIKNEFNEHF